MLCFIPLVFFFSIGCILFFLGLHRTKIFSKSVMCVVEVDAVEKERMQFYFLGITF